MERTKWRRKDNNGENDDGRIREWTASAKQDSRIRIDPLEESLPTEITRALRADNRIIAAIHLFWRSSLSSVRRFTAFFDARKQNIQGEDARGDYRSDKSAFETLNLGFETGASFSFAIASWRVVNLVSRREGERWFLEMEFGWGGFPLAGQIKQQVTFKI